MCSERKPVIKLPHHEQQEYALDRPPYRQGRKLTAVKVYTVNDESQHLLVFGVPQIKLKDELNRLASKFGIVKLLTVVNNYERGEEDKFTDVYHLHYRRIQAARFAKKQLDERCFFGGILHVCYAPELESVSETRIKLIQRRREVAARIEANNKEAANPSTKTKSKPRILQRSKKHPALPIQHQSSECTLSSNNQPYEPSVPCAHTETETLSQSFPSYQATNSVMQYPMEPNRLMPVINVSQTSVKRQLEPQQSTSKKFCGINNTMLVQPSIGVLTQSGYNNHQVGKVSACQLSDDNVKSLRFLPRQISRPSAKQSNSKIVFHKK